MNSTSTILDTKKEIILDRSNPPFNNYQAFGQNYVGLKVLADTVREHELQVIKNDPYAKHVALHAFANISPVVSCSFSWFSVTLVNYLRLVALVELMGKENWNSQDLVESSNRNIVKKHCTEFVREAVPEIYKWRNKVSAHFAITDPFIDDSLGTIEQSIMNPITYRYPYYYAGMLKWNTQNSTSELPEWSLSETYERLSDRFWPEMKLKPFPDENL